MTESIARILVPVDFSLHSDRALAYATTLAGRMDATLVFLHVVEDPIATDAWSAEVYLPNIHELRELQIEHATQRLDALRAAAGAGGVTAEAAVLPGQPARTIVEHALTGGFDLIVMATQGRAGLSHLLLGSVAEYVVRHAACPVLTVRADADTGTSTASAAA